MQMIIRTDNDQTAKADEIWRDVVGYEGLYKISSLGNIETVKRQGSKGGKLKTRVDKAGYVMVSLCKDGCYKIMSVHRLVALAFVDNPNGYPFVNHKDECKSNNAAINLEWCTCQYNNNYGTARQRASVARYRPCIGKWPDGTEKIFNSCTLASRATGIAQGNIWGACNGLWKTAGGVTWEYV